MGPTLGSNCGDLNGRQSSEKSHLRVQFPIPAGFSGVDGMRVRAEAEFGTGSDDQGIDEDEDTEDEDTEGEDGLG